MAFLVGLAASTAAAGSASAAPAVKSVNCNADGDLQSALNAVRSGGTVTVTGVCTGNFSIAKNLTLAGTSGAILDGGGAGRVLDIGPSLTVRLSHLTVQDGNSSEGGGMFVGDSTHLRLSHVTVAHNQSFGGGAGIATDDGAVITAVHSAFTFNNSALTDNTPVRLTGGAILSAGSVILDHSTLTDNSLTATSPNSIAFGGAIYVVAKLEVTDSTFARNIVRGTSAQGGSIFATTGSSLQVTGSSFTDDQAKAVDPADPQFASGGSIVSLATTSSLRGVRITGSRAETSGPVGGQALGGGADFGEPARITGSVFTDNSATAATTGTNSQVLATGGGLHLESGATTTISRTTFDHNAVTARSTQGSAYAQGGGVLSEGQLGLSSSTISRNKVAASSGVMATGKGGGIMVASTTHPATITNSTIVGNTSAATLSKGAPSTATTAGSGGGVQDESMDVAFRFDTVVGNSAQSASGGLGGGLDLTAGMGLPKPTTVASIWSGNRAKTGSQCARGFISVGWNMFGSLSNCPTTTKKSDLTHGHARLGSLASNGGPTKTIALKPGSVALDQVPRTTCRAIVTTDQRGVSRPQGATKKASRRRCDIGAYERVVHHR
jgi:nitrous oxidase accessory protein NosD